MGDPVNHPDHYGGKDNPYEAIKVIEAWDLGFHLGNCVKYIARAGKKLPERSVLSSIQQMARETELRDLKKARWYLDRHISNLENHEESETP